MRFMAMELMGKANVCATQVPSVIDIVARYYGIHIPERVKGKGDGARILPWVPSPSTCLRICCEMGALSQLQMGEYIIEKGGSAGLFSIHSDGATSDGATSDGTKMSAFVLGQRSADATGASKINNLLLEMNSSNDKTSETRAGDFREALRHIAEHCKKTGMTKAELIGDLQPSAAMNDRAAPERLAARIMLRTDLDGPTCGEHGALTNPMNAGTKAMDAILQGLDGYDRRGDPARLLTVGGIEILRSSSIPGICMSDPTRKPRVAPWFWPETPISTVARETRARSLFLKKSSECGLSRLRRARSLRLWQYGSSEHIIVYF